MDDDVRDFDSNFPTYEDLTDGYGFGSDFRRCCGDFGGDLGDLGLDLDLLGGGGVAMGK